MKRTLLTTAVTLGLCLGASADILVQWDFNSTPFDGSSTTGTLVPSVGTGTAAGVGGVATSFNAPGGGTDPLAADANNSCWKLNTFPAQSTGNKTAGVQFNFNTTGYEGITLTWDHINSVQGSKYWRIQYSVDNGATWVDKDVYSNPAASVWNSWSADFSAVPGANNNPNFGVRLVSEYQSTATGAGLDVYVPAGGGGYTYTSAGVLRVEMVTFSGTRGTGEVAIFSDPTNQVVAVGQPAEFGVTAGGGSTTITYQWRHNTSPITGATNAVYSIAAAQLADAGSYDVIVANAVNSLTSQVATLTVRQPQPLAWTGQNGPTWDSYSANWLNTTTLAQTTFGVGDNVLFDSRGVASPLIYLYEEVRPSSVTVNADTDYTLLSMGGRIAGPTGLTKRGSGSLIVGADNSYTGPTVIEAGTVQVGAADIYGSLGAGPVTNNSALLFNRAGTTVIPNLITGSGSITNAGTNVTLSGDNVYTGPIVAKAGSLVLFGDQMVNSTDIYAVPSTATGPTGATKLGIGGGMVIGAGTTVHLSGMDGALDLGCTFLGSQGSNTLNGPLVLDGTGSGALASEGTGTILCVNGNVSGPSFTGAFFLRGNNGLGILNGTINLPNLSVHKTDSSTWTVNSTGNSWSVTSLAVGTLRLGADNALPTGLTLLMGQVNKTATLDLGGFNQQINSLQDGTGTTAITNSSATADSTLTVGSGSFVGLIRDGRSHKTALTLNGTTLTLSGTNTYSGATTVAAGTLALSGEGAIDSSSVINLAGGGLDVSARNDATLTLGMAQTFKGNGTLNLTGNLVNNGIIELKVNKASGIISADKVAVSGQVTYGGTLRLVLSGQALKPTDVLPIFAAGSYNSSAFASIDPAVPAPGLTWDTSTLATDGKLRIAGTVPPTIDTTVLSPAGIIFRGSGGPANGTFSVLAATNLVAPVFWTSVQSGSFDGSGNFSVTNPISPGVPQKFFRLQVP